jgi:hypothetical protein
MARLDQNCFAMMQVMYQRGQFALVALSQSLAPFEWWPTLWLDCRFGSQTSRFVTDRQMRWIREPSTPGRAVS